jgi:hypothetical protein
MANMEKLVDDYLDGIDELRRVVAGKNRAQALARPVPGARNSPPKYERQCPSEVLDTFLRSTIERYFQQVFRSMFQNGRPRLCHGTCDLGWAIKARACQTHPCDLVEPNCVLERLTFRQRRRVRPPAEFEIEPIWFRQRGVLSDMDEMGARQRRRIRWAIFPRRERDAC